MSQIRWGAPVREVPGPSGTEVEYQTVGGAWQNTLKLKTPISRADIIAAEQGYGRQPLVPASWDLNDFGPRGYGITGTDQLVHTSPPNETEFSDKLQEKLQFSHGCIHIKPSERNLLEEMKLLKGGVTIIIRPYKRGTETYGAPL
jgi:hypothetical protein